MKKFIFAALYFVFLGLQAALPQPWWLKFDLPLLFVYSLAMLYGPYIGAGAGAAAGLVYDLLNGAVFGFHIFTRSAAAFAAGFVKEHVIKEHAAYHIAAALVITAGIRMLFFVVQLLLVPLVDAAFVTAFVMETLAYCLGNMILVVPVYRLCCFIDNWHKEE